MSSPFVAEIRMFAGNFAPTGWATCDGQILPISQNTALFSLLGTFYGGNGQSTFALPNLQDSVPIHQGQGPGLSQYFLGQQGGSGTITLLNTEMTAHTHFIVADNADVGNLNAPSPLRSLARSGAAQAYVAAPNSGFTPMAFQAISVTGSSLPHNNMMPFLTVTFCIALQGVFPPRS